MEPSSRAPAVGADVTGAAAAKTTSAELANLELANVAVAVTPSKTGDVVTITMNRPGRRNALSLDHMRDLITAFEAVAETEAVGVIVAGSGSAFCAGHDFADMAGADYSFTRDLLGVCTDLMLLVQDVPQVVIARVHGIATAAGSQLVASCDLAVASESATFAAPGGKGGWFCHTPMVGISRNIGRKRAMELSLTGDAIDAETALAWGLLNSVVPDDALDDAVADLMHRATRGSRFSKAIGKQTLYRHLDLNLPEAYRHVVEVMAATSQSHDAQEGMTSFVEKRPATWEHR